ncbi:MAG: hypothetical protein ACI4EX_03630 [Lachnospiraceae bacterium]
MKKKILACLLAGTMALSMVACGEKPAENTDVSVEQSNTEPTPEVEVTPSIDFEDGSISFIAPYMKPADAAEVELSVVDFNGSKALQVKNLSGKVPYIAFDADSLLGADVAKVAKIQMKVGISYDNGGFSAVSGSIYAWSGEDLVESSDTWSVYVTNKNPNKAVAELSAGEEFVAGANNIFYINLKTDNGVADGNGNATMYIDDIAFLDADGNTLTADTSVAFVAPDGFENSGVDNSNLCALTNAVNFEGFAVNGGAWSQNGIEMPQEVIDALVPGSVVEIEFASGTGNCWVVMPDSAAGWMRIGVGDCDGSGQGYAYYNNSGTKAQITYETFAEYLGEDVSQWGARMQCESDGDWEVFSIKVGQRAPRYTMAGGVEFAGFATSGGAWSQNGFDIPQEIIDALEPGTAVALQYTSTSGDLWVVMPDAAAGWTRVGVGDIDGSGSSLATFDGEICYVPYEFFVEKLGEDKSTWGGRMQCESSGDWEVFSAKVGTLAELPMVNKKVNFEGFSIAGGGWSQDGFEMPEEIVNALVPGSVVCITYSSENGEIWAVMPDAAAGWTRVGVGNYDGSGSTAAACENGVCYIPYDYFVEKLGDDVSTWGARMQCEASGAWEVYSVAVGQMAE